MSKTQKSVKVFSQNKVFFTPEHNVGVFKKQKNRVVTIVFL
tara:strand:- start:4161 stop:4283 length:123 start_codon:yes stop_codon:yes gene_type:complete